MPVKMINIQEMVMAIRRSYLLASLTYRPVQFQSRKIAADCEAGSLLRIVLIMVSMTDILVAPAVIAHDLMVPFVVVATEIFQAVILHVVLCPSFFDTSCNNTASNISSSNGSGSNISCCKISCCSCSTSSGAISSRCNCSLCNGFLSIHVNLLNRGNFLGTPANIF